MRMWIRKPARSAWHYIVLAINQISRSVGILSIIFLLLMMMLTVADVVLRYIFNAPIVGSLELTEFLMVVAGFFAVAWCAVKRGHIKVDLVLSRLSPRFQAITDSITFMLALSVVSLVSWQGFAQARYEQLEQSISEILKIPYYPFYAIVGLGYGLLFLVLVTLLAESIAKAAKR